MSNVNETGYKTVINLCESFQLTAAQTLLLNKGLTFIPSLHRPGHKCLKDQTRMDLQNYHRKLKLSVYYDNKPDSVHLPFIPKSTWVPSAAQLPPEVTKLTQSDIEYFQKHHKIGWNKPNLNKFETEALHQLSENNEIVIKPADKGSSVVLMDRKDYLWEGYRQLNDKNYYTKLNKPIYKDTIPLVNKILLSLYNKKFINHKQKTYLQGNKEPRMRRFYLLPKIHKRKETWSLPFCIPPGRPIVSDCESETYFTAEFIDYYLNPLSTLHPSYIKDTYDFVEKIRSIIVPPSAFLFSLDVDSLYTNIQSSEGLLAVKNTFLKYPNSKRPDKEILQLLEINLTKNDFEFDGQFFLQIRGTAMGKKFAPSYANLFMAAWEESALESCQKKPLHYFRYLDDIWGIWDHSKEEFEQFIITLNNHRQSIKLKSTINQESIDFLDTTTFKGADFSATRKLDVRVFFKETDTHALLFRSSHHPKHTFAGLVKSQLLRFKRICTRAEDFRAAVKVLFSSLLTRGYSYTMLRQALRTFTRVKPICLDPILPIIITYSSENVKLAQQLKRNFISAGGNRVFLKDHRLIAAFRKNHNLRDILVKAKLRPLQAHRTRSQGDFFRHYRMVQNQNTKEVFETQRNTTVHHKNIVYLIRCLQCTKQYVGESGNTMLTRFTQHRYNINNQKNLHIPLVQHFIDHGWCSLRATILESNPTWSVKQRRRVERSWITRLGTHLPSGLNER